jgi:hypothetical protein
MSKQEDCGVASPLRRSSFTDCDCEVVEDCAEVNLSKALRKSLLSRVAPVADSISVPPIVLQRTESICKNPAAKASGLIDKSNTP